MFSSCSETEHFSGKRKHGRNLGGRPDPLVFSMLKKIKNKKKTLGLLPKHSKSYPFPFKEKIISFCFCFYFIG